MNTNYRIIVKKSIVRDGVQRGDQSILTVCDVHRRLIASCSSSRLQVIPLGAAYLDETCCMCSANQKGN